MIDGDMKSFKIENHWIYIFKVIELKLRMIINLIRFHWFSNFRQRQ